MNLPTAEIVCLGNELLIGVTVNTNATYIGEKLTKLGYEVRRVTAIRDDINLATEFFEELFARAPDIVIVSGGLGPTYDDIQLEVIARATQRKLIENEEAIKQIKQYYEKKGLKLTKERRKMAFLPEGSIILRNHVGGAPACYLKFKNMEIFCLPGVPTEMKDIFQRYIIPFLQKKKPKQLFELKFQVLNTYESQLAPFINIAKEKFSELYIKSHPAYKSKTGIVIHISGMGEKAKLKVEKAKELLISQFKENLQKIEIKDLEDD
ncbi:MAG: molybdopterin-binding protein [Candidatus Heimdallarchaeaceae archaeon]